MDLMAQSKENDIQKDFMTHMCPHCGHVFNSIAPLIIRKKTYSEVQYIFGNIGGWEYSDQETMHEDILGIVCGSCNKDVSDYFAEEFIDSQ